MIQENELKIELEQEFSVPRERVYEAWTDPEQLRQWWKPLDNELKEIKNELKEGGNIDYHFEGEKLHISGNYNTVEENELLEYTWNWELPGDPVKNSSYKLAIKFAGTEKGSSIKVTQNAFTNEEGMLPHQEGWKKGLNDLSAYLTATTK